MDSKFDKDFKIIKVEVHKSFHKEFKDKCKSKDTNMSLVLIDLITAYIKSN